MSVLIKGMEMPRSCSVCPMLEGDGMDGLCHAASRWLDDDEYWTWYVYPEGDMDVSKPCNCPLVPVPPHGRLIDADALIEEVAKMVPWAIADPTANAFLEGLSAAYEAFRAAPTIIEAELPVHHGTFAAASEKEALERIIPAEEGNVDVE